MKLIQNIKFSGDLEILKLESDGAKYFANYYGNVSAGFPSPAEDFQGTRISLDERYLSKPESTFITRVGGLSMYPFYQLNDVLINRTDLELQHGDDAVVSINNGDFTLKRWDAHKNMFTALNEKYKESFVVTDEDVVVSLGVVVAIVRELKAV